MVVMENQRGISYEELFARIWLVPHITVTDPTFDCIFNPELDGTS